MNKCKFFFEKNKNACFGAKKGVFCYFFGVLIEMMPDFAKKSPVIPSHRGCITDDLIVDSRSKWPKLFEYGPNPLRIKTPLKPKGLFADAIFN